MGLYIHASKLTLFVTSFRLRDPTMSTYSTPYSRTMKVVIGMVANEAKYHHSMDCVGYPDYISHTDLRVVGTRWIRVKPFLYEWQYLAPDSDFKTVMPNCYL